MRTIKFRGWHSSQQRMIQSHEMVKDQLTLLTDGRFINVSGKNLQDSVIYPPDKFIPLQYTGINEHGLNGKEVWDSDIIKNVDTKLLQVVFWNEDEGAWYCRYIEDEKRIVSLVKSIGNLNEVIGNIYENPELLKN